MDKDKLIKRLRKEKKALFKKWIKTEREGQRLRMALKDTLEASDYWYTVGLKGKRAAFKKTFMKGGNL
jgi:N6-adenosine-specific RNA methylase IME4